MSDNEFDRLTSYLAAGSAMLFPALGLYAAGVFPDWPAVFILGAMAWPMIRWYRHLFWGPR